MTTSSRSFQIVSYRDFYDVPRLILAMDECSRYWIFDCGFDDELDDYPSDYRVYFIGNDLNAAEEAMTMHVQGVMASIESVVPVASLEFDSSKRHSFEIEIAGSGSLPDRS